jgi:hypothetical protein
MKQAAGFCIEYQDPFHTRPQETALQSQSAALWIPDQPTPQLYGS